MQHAGEENDWPTREGDNMHCASCGAILPAKSHVCRYCGGLNDTDLRGVPHDGGSVGVGERHCPTCAVSMHRLKVLESVVIDRCDTCRGLFFLPSQLEVLIDTAIRNVYHVDFQRLEKIVEEEGVGTDRSQRYIKCPDCDKVMNRRQFGARSGVVIDRCSQHGVWLDAGELGQILKWAKAGGRIHDERQQIESLRQEKLKAKGEIRSPLDFRNAFDDEGDELTRRLKRLFGGA